MNNDQPTVPHPVSLMTTKFNKEDRNRATREAEINRMCDAFDAHFNEPNKINYRDMEKFKPLFSSDMRRRVENHEISMEEEGNLAELSNELMGSLNNIYGEIHVVDDRGNDVMPPLPPLFSRIHTLSGEGNTAIQILFNAFSRDDSTPMGTIQQKKATVHLSRLLAMSQNAPEVVAKIKHFNELVDAYNQETQEKQEAQEQRKENQKVNTDNSEQVLSFDDD